MTETNYCEGCISYSFIGNDRIHPQLCNYSYFNQDGKCPCTSCIVKVMCTDVCDKYKDFTDIADSKHGSEWEECKSL